MAKKEKSLFTFKDLLSTIDTSIKGTSIIRETEKSQKKRDMISTGIYVLNAAISGSLFGGIARNRITAIGGKSATGKSYLCYNICKQAQESGYSIVYIDTEFSIELDQLPNYGIDISQDRFSLIRSNVIEDLKITVTRILDALKAEKEAGKELPKLLFVLDSVGQMASRKETEDALSGKEKADFTKAKALGSFFRIINSDLGFLNIPMLCTNHTYESIDMYPTEHMKGGCLIPEHLIQTRDGLKMIKDITKGDYVLTLDGYDEVLETHNYEKETIEFELSNGNTIIVSKNHKFLVKSDYTNENSWKTADELNENDTILSI